MKTDTIINQAINLFWSIIGFTPVYFFWMENDAVKPFFITLGVSLLVLGLPSWVVRKLQLSSKKTFYKNLGVTQAQSITQNGALVNRWIKKTNLPYAVIKNRRDLKKFKMQMLINEKFHLACLVFFTVSMLRALYLHKLWMAALILVANVIFNIYPLLIQQYNRLRFSNSVRYIQGSDRHGYEKLNSSIN